MERITLNLTGSEKQITWANDIINHTLNYLNKKIKAFQDGNIAVIHPEYTRAISAYTTVKSDFLKTVESFDNGDAKRIIDNREALSACAAEAKANEIAFAIAELECAESN